MSYTLLPVNAEGNDEVETVDIIKISSADELITFAKRVNGGETSLNAELTKGIDMSTETNYTPIGTSDKPYSGTFDGNGKTVTLNISSKSNDVGLFGYINGATIQNVGVAGEIEAKQYVGGIVANASGNSTIENCWNKATITASNYHAGGIVGIIDSGNVIIENCYNNGSVTSKGIVGGIAGYNLSGSSSITNCYNTGTIKASSEDHAGGITSHNYGTITNCYNTGTVTANTSNAGGIASINYGSIKNCYNTETVTANSDAGGIVGTNYASVTNCYNTEAVTASSSAGGIAGDNSFASIINCYNTGAVTASSSAGGIAGSNNNNGSITNCYNTGTIKASSEDHAGGITSHNYGTITNCYYLKDISGATGSGDPKDKNEFSSGAVTWLLNSNKSEGVWKQTLVEGEDEYPNFMGLTVCYDETKQYYNIAPKPSIASSSVTADNITIELNNYNDGKYGNVKYSLGTGENWTTVEGLEGNSFAISGLKGITEYTIYLKYTGTDQIPASDDGVTEVSIATAKYTNSWKEDKAPLNKYEYTYGAVDEPSIEAEYGDIILTYYTDESCNNPTTTDNSGAETTGGKPVNAGTYYIIASVESGDTYESLVSEPIEFTINKAPRDAPNSTGFTVTNETIDGIKDGKISGLSTDMEYATTENASDSEYIEITATDMTFASGTYYIRYAGDENHNASPATEVTIGAGKKLTVTVPEKQIGYTLTVKDKELSYNGETTLSFSLKDGYSKTNEFSITANGQTLTENTDGTYTLSDVTSDVSISVDGVKDITPPTGSIKVSENIWKTFLNTITFGLFFKETQTVTITGEDAGSGIASIEYYLLDSQKTLDEVQKIDSWEKLEISNGQISFDINPNDKYIIYAKITDIAGNVTYISSDGIVLYTDAEQVTSELEYVKGQINSNLTAKVKLNGNTINSISFSGQKLENTQIDDEMYNISEKPDDDGYSTITFNNDIFKDLSLGNYTLIISYNPLGEVYQKDEVDINNKPAKTFITLKIGEQLTYTVENSDLTYNGNKQNLLKVDVEGGIVYYSTDEENWSTDVPKETNAGTYTVYYKIDADSTHIGSVGSTKVEVIINKQEIEIPSANANLIYTGEELTGVNAEIGYTLEGNTATNVGNYTATATPDDNHQWKNSETPNAPVTIKWTIGKADSTITITAEFIDKTYDGNAVSVPAIEKTGSSGNISFEWYIKNSDKWEQLNVAPTSVGNYKVIAKLEEDNNYNGAETEKIFTISKCQIEKPQEDTTKFDYNGNEKTYTLIEDNRYKISNNKRTVSGEQNVTVTLNDKNNYEWEDGTIDDLTFTFIINKAVQSDISINMTGYEYGGKISIPSETGTVQENAEITYYYKLADSNSTVKVWKDMTSATLDAGTYEMYAVLKETANYKSYITKTVSFTVEPKTIGVEWSNTKLTYNGQQQQPTATATDIVNGDTVNINVSVVESDHTNAGTYTATASITNTNYVLKETKETSFTIKPKTLTKEMIDLSDDSYLFTGKEITPTITVSDSNILTDNDYSISGTTTALAYGTYRITVKGQNNYSGSVKIEWNITDSYSPTGSIEVSKNIWTSFLYDITFGYFFKETQTVTITGEDTGSGIASIEYYLLDSQKTLDEVQKIDSWEELEISNGQISFDINPNDKYIIYAKITDIAGNTTYISSDGIVLDGIAPAITGVENNQTYYTTQKITVSDDYLDTVTVNGEKVTLTDGQLTLEGNVDEVYKIVVSDKAGNSTTITITMKETSTVSKEIENLKTDTVTSQDKTTIEENLNKINELLKDENLTEEERSILEELKKEAQDLLDKIEEVETEIKEVTDIINSYENITLSDRTVIQDTLERIETLLNSNHITEEERIKLNEVKEKGELLLKEINEIEVDEEKNVNTGDMNQYMIYIILMILSGRYVLRLRRNEE